MEAYVLEIETNVEWRLHRAALGWHDDPERMVGAVFTPGEAEYWKEYREDRPVSVTVYRSKKPIYNDETRGAPVKTMETTLHALLDWIAANG